MQKTQLAAALVAVLGLSLNGMARAADNTETTEKTEVKTEKKVKMDKKECKKECVFMVLRYSILTLLNVLL